MWLKLGKNWRRSIKNQLTQTDSALKADQKLLKNHGDLMLPDRIIATQSADIRKHQHFSWTLHSSGSIKDASEHHSSFTIFDKHSMKYRAVQVDFQFYPIWTTWFHICSEPCCAHVKRPIFWKLPAWLGISKMKFLMAEVIWCNDNFLTRGCSKNQISKQFSDFVKKFLKMICTITILRFNQHMPKKFCY